MTTVKQPFPLPQGVSDFSISGLTITQGALPSYTPLGTKSRNVPDRLSTTDSAGSNMGELEISEEEELYKSSEVDIPPEFPGGEEKMMGFIQKHLAYPREAKEKGVHGTVILSFIVGTDGKIREIKVIRKVLKELNSEVVRVVKEMPAWKPGEYMGFPVAVKYSLPVEFRL